MVSHIARLGLIVKITFNDSGYTVSLIDVPEKQWLMTLDSQDGIFLVPFSIVWSKSVYYPFIVLFVFSPWNNTSKDTSMVSNLISRTFLYELILNIFCEFVFLHSFKYFSDDTMVCWRNHIPCSTVLSCPTILNGYHHDSESLSADFIPAVSPVASRHHPELYHRSGQVPKRCPTHLICVSMY